MNKIIAYIGYITGICGFAGIVWTYATKSAEDQYNVKDLQNDVIEIKADMVSRNELNLFADSTNHYYKLIRMQNRAITSQNQKIITLMTKHIANTVTPDSMRLIMSELYEKKN